MNIRALNEAISNSGIKKKTLKEALDCTYFTLNRKLSGQSELTATDITALSNALRLTSKETTAIFFK